MTTTELLALIFGSFVLVPAVATAYDCARVHHRNRTIDRFVKGKR